MLVKTENMTLQKIDQHLAVKALALSPRLIQKALIVTLTTVVSICTNANSILAQQIDSNNSNSIGFSVPRERYSPVVLDRRIVKKTNARNRFRVVYGGTNSKDPFTNEYFRSARRVKLLENLAVRIGRFRLPRPISLVMRDCGVANAFYDPSGSITLCSELITDINQTFIKKGFDQRSASRRTSNAIIFTLYHEIGHLLINELDLPITGKEEDAADQLATVSFLSGAKNNQGPVTSALLLLVSTKDNLGDSRTFRGPHSLNRQRAYYLLCELYIKNPDSYAKLVIDLGYNYRDLSSCRQQSSQIRRSWLRLLAPHSIR
jgi:Putative metallopeptidase